MFRKLLVLPVLALAVMAAPSQAQKKIQHPKMHAALYELRQARKVVSGLKDDLGGRKEKSLSAIDDAVRSVRLILAVGVDDPSPIRRDKDFYKKWKDNPNIRAAWRICGRPGASWKRPGAISRGTRSRRCEISPAPSTSCKTCSKHCADRQAGQAARPQRVPARLPPVTGNGGFPGTPAIRRRHGPPPRT